MVVLGPRPAPSASDARVELKFDMSRTRVLATVHFGGEDGMSGIGMRIPAFLITRSSPCGIPHLRSLRVGSARRTTPRKRTVARLPGLTASGPPNFESFIGTLKAL